MPRGGDVIQVGGKYYACVNAVWFVADGPEGPWEVATSVPPELYQIPLIAQFTTPRMSRWIPATDDSSTAATRQATSAHTWPELASEQRCGGARVGIIRRTFIGAVAIRFIVRIGVLMAAGPITIH